MGGTVEGRSWRLLLSRLWPVGRPWKGLKASMFMGRKGWEDSLGRRRLLKELGQPFSSEKQLQRQGEHRGLKAPMCNRSIPPLLVLEQTAAVSPLGLQDIKKSMDRCAAGQFQLSEEVPDLEERLTDLSRKGAALKETLNRFQDHVISAVERAETMKMVNDKADSSLDPGIPNTLLPMDQRSTGHGEFQHRLPALQYTPDIPKELDSRALVLGCDGFTSGRYFWELEVGDGEYWAVGVARDPSKKGMADFCPEEGIWAVGLWKGQHWALTSPVTALSLNKHPRRIRVSLDYVGECVTFTDADTDDPIFTFPPASFNGTRSQPLLWVVGFPAQTVFLRRMGVKYPAGVHEMDLLSP